MKGWLVSDRMFPSRSCAPSPRRLISALSNSLCKCSIEHQPRPRATAVNSSYTGLLTHVLEHHTTENQGERSLNEKRERKEEEEKKNTRCGLSRRFAIILYRYIYLSSFNMCVVFSSPSQRK